MDAESMFNLAKFIKSSFSVDTVTTRIRSGMLGILQLKFMLTISRIIPNLWIKAIISEASDYQYGGEVQTICTLPDAILRSTSNI